MSRAIRLPNTRERPQGANDNSRRAKRHALTGAEKIANALRDIERDVESNNGLYPLNRGRITQQEVLRRAALSSAFLEKSRNKKVKAHVAQWAGWSERTDIAWGKDDTPNNHSPCQRGN